jgi:hypothetical protein
MIDCPAIITTTAPKKEIKKFTIAFERERQSCRL